MAAERSERDVELARQRAAIDAETRGRPDLIPSQVWHDGSRIQVGQTWEGRARMAEARTAAGLPLDDLDREALARSPR